MKFTKVNWYGFNHEGVCARYNVTRFVNSFCVYGEYSPVAVYYSAQPDRSLGHKDYLLLQLIRDPESGREYGMVRGMDEVEMVNYRFQDAIWCSQCDEVVFSVMRHDDRKCSCGAVSIDGGADYVRVTDSEGVGTIVTLDFVTDSIIPEITQATN